MCYVANIKQQINILLHYQCTFEEIALIVTLSIETLK